MAGIVNRSLWMSAHGWDRWRVAGNMLLERRRRETGTHGGQVSSIGISSAQSLLDMHIKVGRSAGWQPWYSLETLKTSFNVSSEYQCCHPDDISVSVHRYLSQFKLVSECRCRCSWHGNGLFFHRVKIVPIINRQVCHAYQMKFGILLPIRTTENPHVRMTRGRFV